VDWCFPPGITGLCYLEGFGEGYRICGDDCIWGECIGYGGWCAPEPNPSNECERLAQSILQPDCGCCPLGEVQCDCSQDSDCSYYNLVTTGCMTPTYDIHGHCYGGGVCVYEQYQPEVSCSV